MRLGIRIKEGKLKSTTISILRTVNEHFFTRLHEKITSIENSINSPYFDTEVFSSCDWSRLCLSEAWDEPTFPLPLGNFTPQKMHLTCLGWKYLLWHPIWPFGWKFWRGIPLKKLQEHCVGVTESRNDQVACGADCRVHWNRHSSPQVSPLAPHTIL